MSKRPGQGKMLFFIIALTIIALAGGWKVKYVLARKTADSYLKRKYDVEMIYKTMYFTITDPSGYHIAYTPANNEGISFTVVIYSSLYNKGYIDDNYRLNWFCWELQEQMNIHFSEYLEELGKESKIQVILNYYINDGIDDNLPVFEIQKEIPYYINIYTDCTDEDKFINISNNIKSQGYVPQKIRKVER